MVIKSKPFLTIHFTSLSYEHGLFRLMFSKNFGIRLKEDTFFKFSKTLLTSCKRLQSDVRTKVVIILSVLD